VGLRVGADGLELRVLDQPFEFVEDGVETSVPIPVLESPGVEVGLPLLDLGLYTPELDTPVAFDFNGLGVNGAFDGTSITNSVSPGMRELFSFGEVADGIKDTDVGRFDVDLDVLSAVAWGVPLGVEASVGSIPLAGSLLEVEANLFDFDTAVFLGFQERLRFEPRLMVDLQFNQPTLVETAPGAGEFEEVTSRLVEVGAELQIVHPGGDLVVDPIYTLQQNLFVNDTDLIVTPGIAGNGRGTRVRSASCGLCPERTLKERAGNLSLVRRSRRCTWIPTEVEIRHPSVEG
jgi:hypothetical protein